MSFSVKLKYHILGKIKCFRKCMYIWYAHVCMHIHKYVGHACMCVCVCMCACAHQCAFSAQRMMLRQFMHLDPELTNSVPQTSQLVLESSSLFTKCCDKTWSDSLPGIYVDVGDLDSKSDSCSE